MRKGRRCCARALDPFTAPAPSTADGPDPRSPARRQADGLIELARRALTAGDLPETGGPTPAGHRHPRLGDSPHPVGGGGARLGRAGHRGVGPADRLRRPTHPRPARHGRATPGRRAGQPHHSHGDPPRADRPGPGLRVPRLRPARRLVRRTPHRATGPTADPPRSPTWCCSAGTTTAPSTTTTGRSESINATGYPRSCRHPGSTPTRPPAATGCTTSPPCPTHPSPPEPTHRGSAPYSHGSRMRVRRTADPRARGEHRTRYPHNPASDASTASDDANRSDPQPRRGDIVRRPSKASYATAGSPTRPRRYGARSLPCLRRRRSHNRSSVSSSRDPTRRDARPGAAHAGDIPCG